MPDPYLCPNGHYNVEMGVNRCWCETCRLQGNGGGFDKSEMQDARRLKE